ncbi:MAG: holo-ACP synthase [Acidiferrobacterales bacterium]
MIFGIGTDIVRIARMQRNLERFGERFARRILTEQELSDYQKENKRAHFLARRFAAKEAAAKAMGLGFSGGLGLRQIGVAHDQKGKPLLEFTGFASEFVSTRGITQFHVSLADEEDHAVAVVTLVTG